MTTHSPWPVIHRERTTLAAHLAELPATAWGTPSLCQDWSVQDVLGHIVSTAKMTPPRFFAKFAGSGFRFGVMANREIARETAAGPGTTLAELRAHAGDSTAPPGPVTSWLGEIIVHGTDIRWPLGIDHDYPVDALIRVAEFYRGSNALIGAKNRIAGVTLTATDTEWTTGTGPEVTGSLHALVMAMTGRRAALSRLSGDGLAVLTPRFAAA